MSLNVKGLTKSFGSLVAVDNLNMEMDRPGVYGLIGTNGAGKTTTIRCILNIMEPDRGESLWNGKKITRQSLNFGYMPEERGLYLKVKVKDQLVYFGMLRGMTKQDATKSADKYLERLNITEYGPVIAEKLSKGNQQKVQLIAALIHDPILIFLDEPFSGLDPINTAVFSELVHELVDRGCFIILSSHQMNTVEEYCRDILILHEAKTVLSGNLKTIKSGYGFTNLIISKSAKIKNIASTHRLSLISERADEIELKVDGKDEARRLLKALVDSDIYPSKFVLKEPSLNEIFVEKVGNYK